jgi:hypothetical protein
MCNDADLIIEETIDLTLSIIKDIDILMENEKDQTRLMEMLHLRDELIDSIPRKTEDEQRHKILPDYS